MGVMRVMNASGHAELEWDTSNTELLSAARAEFGRLRGLGFVPVRRDGDQYTKARGFDEEAAEIYWLRPLQGG